MKTGRTFLAIAYIVLMVLMPVFHIAAEACGTTASDGMAGHDCDGHRHPKESPGHSPESCAICQLMMMQVAFPEILPTTQVSVLVEPVPAVPETVISRQPVLSEQARAPPFKTA